MRFTALSRMAAALSCAAMFVPPSAVAVSANNALRDVALHRNGTLMGQVVDAQGVPQAQTPVSIRFAGSEIVRTKTDLQGKFTVENLRGGVYEVASMGRQQSYRLWAPQTAPPAAQHGLMLVSNADVVRGQGCGCGSAVTCGSGCRGGYAGGGGGGPLRWMADHPIIAGGAIAAAIAIPLAVDDDDPPATP